MSKYNLVDIFEGMSSDEMSKAQEADRLKDHPERDTIKKIQALMAKEKSVEEGSEQAIDPAEYGDIGQNYLAGFGKENTLDLDSLEKLGRKIVKQLYKGDFAAAKAKFIKEDAIEDEPVTEGDEAVDLAIEASQKKAGIKEDQYDDITDADDDIPADKKKEAALAYRKVDKGASYEKATSHIKEVSSMKDVVLALIKDAKGTNPEIDSYVKSLKQSGDEFDSVDDYVEDFKNYVADKALQEKQYAPEVVDRIEMVRKALWDTNDFGPEEIEAYTRSLVGDFERGDFEAYDDFKADDYVEDIKNYISDKALREHFGRFMKDYQ